MASATDESVNVILIGAGKGGSALLSILKEDPGLSILGVADPRPDAPGLQLARDMGIPIASDYRELLSLKNLDVVIDATGDRRFGQELRDCRPVGVEVMGGLSSKLMWRLVEERRMRERDLRRVYDIGLRLTALEDTGEIFNSIVESTIDLIGVPAASLAVWDRQAMCFRLTAAQGFSRKFTKAGSWRQRPGGLTSYIIEQDVPVSIPDTSKEPGFDNPTMLKERIAAVLAVALKAAGETVGILYADDFSPRYFSTRDKSILSLLANQAALSIQKAQLLRESKELAVTDHLTGLRNHRNFNEVLQKEVERAQRYGAIFSLLMMDLDNFKQVNDRFGHSRGDRVLQQVAEAIRESIRQSDYSARYGGDEFVVILPYTRTNHAVALAQRLRRRINAIDVGGKNGDPVRLSASIGIAEFQRCGVEKDSLIAAADAALLHGKRSGRNTVCRYTPAAAAEVGPS